MTPVPFRIEAHGKEHHRAQFSSGEETLDRYFQTHATQDIRRRIANCFVAIEAATNAIAAYYTIAAASIPLVDLSAEDAKRLPRYPTLPAVLIGRLAVDHKFQRRGLGSALLADAAQRTMQAAPAVYALLVDAKSDRAAAFYQRFGFRPLLSRQKSLYLSIATAQRAFLGKASK